MIGKKKTRDMREEERWERNWRQEVNGRRGKKEGTEERGEEKVGKGEEAMRREG